MVPETLFAFRLAFYEGAWYARCVDCGCLPKTIWKCEKSWPVHILGTERVARLRFPERESVFDGLHPYRVRFTVATPL